MRKLLTILALLLSPLSAWATFGAASAWDVRTTGVDTNGGAYDSGVGSPGTNESLGAGVAITITLTGTTTGTGSPVFSSTTHGPGNFVHIASGAGCTTGWFEILSQSAGTATFDHAMGVSTNVCVGTIGGSLLTIQQATTNMVASNTVWIQSGTYTQTASINWSVSTGAWTGYQTTHGDNGTKPLITTSTNSVTLINTASSNSGNQVFTNLSLSTTAATRLSGIWQASAHGTDQTWAFVNCIFDGFVAAIDNSNGTPDDVAWIQVINTEIKNSGSVGITTGSNAFKGLKVFGSYFHANHEDIDTSVVAPGFVSLAYTIFANSSNVVSGQVMFLSNSVVLIDHCTYANNTALVAVKLSATSGFTSITNTLFYGNNTGIQGALLSANTAGAAASSTNAFGGAGTSYTLWNGSPGDVTLSANPFTNSGSGDYSLNSTAGGGAALKGTGFPGIFPAATTTGHTDIGAVQTAGGGGGSTGGNFGISY